MTARTRLLASMSVAVLVLSAGTACAKAHGAGGPLNAVLVSPTDVALSWTENDPAVAGHTVEYATDPAGPFTILQFVPAHESTYQHSSLMPQTTFYYRTRPYYGPVSNVVAVALPPGALTDDDNGDTPDWAAPQARPQPTASRYPARSPGSAPSGLTATVVDANGIRFTWTDHATGEDGYLMEVKPEGRADFVVVDVLAPGVNEVGLVTMPEQKRAAYRIRAFWYGPPSNVVQEKTGGD